MNHAKKKFRDLYGYNALRELKEGVVYIFILIYDEMQKDVVFQSLLNNSMELSIYSHNYIFDFILK